LGDGDGILIASIDEYARVNYSYGRLKKSDERRKSHRQQWMVILICAMLKNHGTPMETVSTWLWPTPIATPATTKVTLFITSLFKVTLLVKRLVTNVL
jgi:hypothetical protein